MRKNELSLIKQALWYIETEEVKLMDSFPEVAPPHSEEYLKNIEGIKCQARITKDKKNSLKKKILIGIVAALLALLTACSLTKPLTNLVVKIYDKYISIYAESPTVEMTEIYMPTYLPEGYEITSNVRYANIVEIRIDNGEFTILFKQNLLSGNTSVRLDTENAETFELNVDGYTIYGANKFGHNNVMWENGEYVFTIRFPENIPLEDVEKFISGLEAQPLKSPDGN